MFHVVPPLLISHLTKQFSASPRGQQPRSPEMSLWSLKVQRRRMRGAKAAGISMAGWGRPGNHGFLELTCHHDPLGYCNDSMGYYSDVLGYCSDAMVFYRDLMGYEWNVPSGKPTVRY